ncbi:hypothetical protein jhhlp_000199 [Lomentospora prolificans]|uniref:Uncharacterized protein n=1 Tax=Lomentospora prolificans TaxID=41688 RepID=A0A2N3NK87_9PEZI|nr:hypothetical protein jhhlp_000199 [Lomentospora prolificans]
MPQDPDLYGRRPAKKRKQDAGSANSLDFAVQMTALMSDGLDPTNASRRGRRVESRKHGTRAGTSDIEPKSLRTQNRIKSQKTTGAGAESSELDRSREKMKEKARLYSDMKRGLFTPKDSEGDPLVDFDRKWVEEGKHSSDSDSLDEEDEEIIEFEDEFGRTRRGTKAEKMRMERRKEQSLIGTEELESMSARPAAPKKLIYGDAIQSMAFNPEDPEKMMELAQKRDRSATPPESTHYDADAELRDKGVGFYKFSKDKETRKAQLDSLDEQRRATEASRATRKEQMTARQQEIEARKRAIEARKAKKMADSFLDTLAGDI